MTRNVVARLKRRRAPDWEDIGHANGGCALTSLGHRLYLATNANALWRRYPVGAEIPWRRIGHANGVVAMAGAGDRLHCITTDNRMWWRPPLEQDVDWTALGFGPRGRTTGLAAAGGLFCAAGEDGTMWRAPIGTSALAWERVDTYAPDATVTAMTAYSDILFAATDDGRLLRSSGDWISNIKGWREVHHCNLAVGLATVEWMFFVATSDNRLWRMDVHGLREM